MDYANTVCPYCAEALDPLPKAKKRCPSCGQPIFVRSAPDGLRYLLQEADLPVLEQAWTEYHEAQERVEADETNAQAAINTREALASYVDAGMRSVQMSTRGDACPVCGPLDGVVLPIEDAPHIPLNGCPFDVCPCDYIPVVE